MLNLTHQEKQVLLFLGLVVLTGITVNHLVKNSSRVQEFISSPSISHPQIINLNKAAQEELEKLPGIGPALAERIIAFRIANGSFKTIEDIKEVKGIGAHKFEMIKDWISVE